MIGRCSAEERESVLERIALVNVKNESRHLEEGDDERRRLALVQVFNVLRYNLLSLSLPRNQIPHKLTDNLGGIT